MVSEVEEIRKEERDTKDRSRPKDRPGAGGQTGNTWGTGGQAVTRMKQRGASVPVTKATAREPHLPFPHSGPARPRSGRRHRPCFVSMATGGAGPFPNITRCGKHAARGTPPTPAAPARGRALRGPQSSPDLVQICEGPQSPSRSTKPPPPGPAAPSGVQGSPRPRYPDSPRRAALRALPPFASHLWIRRRPPSPEALGPAPRRQAASLAGISRALLRASPGSPLRSA